MYNMKYVRIYWFFNLIKNQFTRHRFIEKYPKISKNMVFFQDLAKR